MIGYPLLFLVNMSLRTEKFHSGVIAPIPKVRNPKTMLDFRLIRVYFEENKLFYIDQSEFRTKHSCESALQFVCAK